MNNGSTATKGYYSILQYVPDPERAEGVNIGLMLFCPEKGFLRIQTSGRDHQRWQNAFFAAQGLFNLGAAAASKGQSSQR